MLHFKTFVILFDIIGYNTDNDDNTERKKNTKKGLKKQEL